VLAGNKHKKIGETEMAKCGSKTEVFSRVCGYHRPVKNWNKGKQEEFAGRKTYTVNNAHSIAGKETVKVA